MESTEENYKVGKHEECKSAAKSEVNHNVSWYESLRQTPRNEVTQFNRSHEEPQRKDEFSLIRDDEQWERTILEASWKGKPYKIQAERLWIVKEITTIKK